MESVKFGRTKVKVTDCVSVPNNYFGADFKARLVAAGVNDVRVYGRVTDVIDGNREFVVRWDFDQLTTSTSLDKVRYEQPDTPFQESRSSSITTADLEELAGPLEQGSEFVEPLDEMYVLFTGKDNTRTNCLLGKLIPCKPGTKVHNHEMGDNEQKFVIEEVIDMWSDFDPDIHSPGSFVVWDKDHAMLKGEEEGEDMKEKEGEKMNEKGDKKKGNKKGGAKKKSVNSKDGGKKFRQSLKEIEDDEDSNSDKEDELKEKPKGRKRKNNSKQVAQEDDEVEVPGWKKAKAKARKTRKVVAKVTLGKNAADKVKQKRKEKGVEEENVLDYEEEDEEGQEEEMTEVEKEKKKKEELSKWKLGGRKIDPRGERNIPGAHLLNPLADLFEEDSFIDYFMSFQPVEYIKEVMLPSTNKFAKDNGWEHEPFSFDEFINVQGILYMMEVVRLPERRMYWNTQPTGLFPGLNFGRIMSLHRFELFLNVWQLSEDEDMDQQVLNFIFAVNSHLKETMRAGEVLCIDESMIKAFHRGLNGKMKIIRKSRPIGNELKTVSDAKTHIVLHMELHESKEDMADKQYVKEYGATTACCLRITEHWKSSGRIVVGDSWFGSVKTCVKLMNINGLYSNMLVKTAHKQYPRVLLRESKVERGEWVSATAEIENVKLMATRFLDLQEKLFVSSCSSDLSGPPRITKHHGDVSRPQVAFDYLSSSASIDIHNHFRTGSTGLEDAWQTKNSNMRQVAGVLGFLLTNAYLAYRYFQKSPMKHCDFKIALANALTTFKEVSKRSKRLSLEVSIVAETSPKVHLPKLLVKPTQDDNDDDEGEGKRKGRYQRYCFWCQHNPKKEPEIRKTSYCCDACGETYPLCHPSTGRECMKLHVIHGLPTKRRFMGQKNK